MSVGDVIRKVSNKPVVSKMETTNDKSTCKKYLQVQNKTPNMTEQDRQIIPLMHCLAVAINTADAIRTHLTIRDKMPRQKEKKDLNRSFANIAKLQYLEIAPNSESGEKKTLLDMFFSDSKQIVQEHSNIILKKMKKTPENYVSLCLVIHSVLEKVEEVRRGYKRKNPMFWNYIHLLFAPVSKYCTPEIENIASDFILNITKMIELK